MVLKQSKRRAVAAAPEPSGDLGREDRRALEALAQVSQMVAGELDLADVVRSSIRAAAEAMNAEACSILLRDPEAECLRFQVADGPKTMGLESATVPIDDHTIAGWVAAHREPALVPDAYQDPRFTPTYDKKTGFRTRSVICAPLVAQGRQLGVMQILNRRDGQAFDARDLELAQAVAGLIAVAVRNAEEHAARLKAERLATVGQTIAGMAHCVKNILNGLRAGSYIIDQNLGDGADPKLAKGWQIVKRNMQVLSHIVLDMLSYSKDRKPLCRPCRIGDLCEDVVGLLQQEAQNKGVTLVTSCDLEEVCVDEAAIRRCLINLVGNAIDACSERGGMVQVEAGAADVPGRFAIRVRDTGCGMEPEARAKIFDAFYSTKGGKGTGLGLAVTRKIVDEHGGEIQVDSEPGAGTEFALILPIRPADETRG